jgi:hypothetical protein
MEVGRPLKTPVNMYKLIIQFNPYKYGCEKLSRALRTTVVNKLQEQKANRNKKRERRNTKVPAEKLYFWHLIVITTNVWVARPILVQTSCMKSIFM